MLPEMATQDTWTMDTKERIPKSAVHLITYVRSWRPLRHPPFQRMEAGLPCVKKSALFERSEFADFSKGVCFQGGGRTGLDFLVTFGSSQK